MKMEISKIHSSTQSANGFLDESKTEKDILSSTIEEGRFGLKMSSTEPELRSEGNDPLEFST